MTDDQYTYKLISDDDGTWFARVVELDGCMTTGTTYDDALAMLEDAKHGWLETAQALGVSIPAPLNAAHYTDYDQLAQWRKERG
jgi:antitoxin HicB